MSIIGIKLFNNQIKPLGDTEDNTHINAVITTITNNQEIAEIEMYLLNTSYKVESFIGRISVENIPPAKAGEPRILFDLVCDSNKDFRVKVKVDNKYSHEMVIPFSNWGKNLSEKVIKEEPTIHEDGESVSLNFIKHDKKTTYEKLIVERKSKPKEPEKTLPKPQKEKTDYQSSEIIDKARQKGSPLKIILILLGIILLGVFIFFMIDLLSKPGSKGIKEPVKSVIPIQKTPAPTPSPIPEKPTPIQSVITQPKEVEEPVKTARPTPKITPEPTPTKVPELDIKAISEKITKILPVHFHPDSTDILEEDINKLEELKTFLLVYKGRIQLQIIGYAASAGNPHGRYTVSLNRAQYIKDYLVNAGAIAAADCEIKAGGATKLLYSGTEPEKQYLNRRIEIVVSGKK